MPDLGNRNAERGFTLIELLIVITVIGIIMAFGVPKYQGVREQYRLESSAQAVMAELKYAKQLSMDRRKSIYVLLTAERVSLFESVSSPGVAVESYGFDMGVVFKPDDADNLWLPEIRLGSGETLGHGLFYDHRGFVSQSGTIWLEAGSGRRVGIQIEKKTGHLFMVWP
ncbi:prepilin-type N-terminal cleavage/methylation domain-containing protein [Desulfitobacterium sp. LBE]|nr:prepilin-type N-terminal cleavage/methylation domain-containing protein [Desulfitobacterium sp. LBE]